VFLEQAFLLPLPKFQGASSVFEAKGCDQISGPADVGYWNRRLDALADDKGLWAQLRRELKEIPQSSLIVLSQCAATSDRQSILHLAVLDDQLDSISWFCKDRVLMERRNRFGLTPLEMALYLHKQKSASILTGALVHRKFTSQSNVEFEKLEFLPLNIEFLVQPVFESSQVLEEVFTYTAKSKSDDAIPHDRIWMGVYFDKEIQHGIHPRMKVSWINREIGFGVFAGERILPCSYVGEYTGLIQERKAKHISESSYCFRYTAWQIGKRRYVVDAENMGNFTRFVNHSDDPNTTLVCAYWRGMPRLIIISLKEISEGTQLTFDYGKTFWKQSPHLAKRDL
jgi:uncharacterized protein